METNDDIPVFPYELVWEGFAEKPATFKSIAENTEKFQIFAETVSVLKPDAPKLNEEKIRALVKQLDLGGSGSQTLERQLLLIAEYYWTPKYRKLLQLDILSSREKLTKAADAASKLDSIMSRLPGEAATVIEFVKTVDPDVIDPGASLLKLGQTAHDFALAARRVVHDTAPKQTGRRSEFVRDDALRLAIEAFNEAGLKNLAISRGTKQNPNWHIKGDVGVALRDYLAIIEPGIKEPALAPIVDKVRRRTRYAASADR